jgi:hypothetical protein
MTCYALSAVGAEGIVERRVAIARSISPEADNLLD